MSIKKFVRSLKYVNPIKGVFYWLVDTYDILRERISRSIAFAVHGWDHYDFEGLYVYDIMAFKLRRVEKTLIKYGHFDTLHPERLVALREAIEICDRLFEDSYELDYVGYPERLKLSEIDRKGDIDRLAEILKNDMPGFWD